MGMIKNLKIRSKILAIVVISIVSLICLGVISLAYMNKVNEGSTEISKNWMPSVIIAEELNRLTSDYRIVEYKHVISTDNADMATIESELNSYKTQIDTMFQSYHGYISNEEDEKLIKTAQTNWNEYIVISNNMIAQSKQNNIEAAMDILNGESRDFFEEVSDLFQEIVDFNKTNGDEASAEGDRLYSSAFATIIIAIVVIILIVIVLSIFISLAITKPVKEIDNIAKKIANEELDNIITYESKDELGNLAKNFNLTVERLKVYINYINEITAILKQIAEGNLNFSLQYEYTGEFSKVKEALVWIADSLTDTLTQINTSSELVANSSAQMAEGAQALAEGATDQAGTVEELVATIQEVSDKIRKNAEDATGANTLVDQTRRDIEQSNLQMKDMKMAMDNINEKSRQIVNIVSSIEDIASQTNLLALNAAIEAARAGDAGRGFAVVAEQVKVLASQSADAAKNTVALIEDSIEAVDRGTNIANNTAESLISVVDSVEQASTTMKEITRASTEQAEFMGQVEQGVESIANVIQNNSATAQESSATSEELSSQAQILRDMVSRFELKQ